MTTRTANAWLPRTAAERHHRLRLFCFPPAGAGAAFYRTWSSAAFSIHPILLPGRESRLREDPRADLPRLVDDLAEAISGHLDRPYAFFGHSMGALLAYETARRLQSGFAPAALVLSGRRGPSTPALQPPIADRDDDRFIDAVAALGGIPAEILDQSDMIRMIRPSLRADFRLNERYRPLPGPRLAGPVALYAGRDDPEAPPRAVLSWGEETDRDHHLRVFNGGHFYFSPDPHRLLSALTEDLHHLGALRSQAGHG
jgi:surfactin synthase thioesterase subunit